MCVEKSCTEPQLVRAKRIIPQNARGANFYSERRRTERRKEIHSNEEKNHENKNQRVNKTKRKLRSTEKSIPLRL